MPPNHSLVLFHEFAVFCCLPNVGTRFRFHRLIHSKIRIRVTVRSVNESRVTAGRYHVSIATALLLSPSRRLKFSLVTEHTNRAAFSVTSLW